MLQWATMLVAAFGFMQKAVDISGRWTEVNLSPMILDDRWGENYLFREQVLQGHDTYEITAVFIVSQPVCSD